MTIRSDARREYEVTLRDGELRAIVAVEGRWVAGSIAYGPPESPDAWVMRAWQSYDDGHEDGVRQERKLDPDALDEDDREALLDEALMRDEAVLAGAR